jgi:DNA ligase-1
MKTFARLVNALDSTNKTTQKLNAIDRFLDEATETDKLWLLALFTGKRPRRPVNSILMRQWAMEITGLPEWLFMESYSSVGDLSETIALILPPPTDRIERTLTEWMTLITELKNKTETEKKSLCSPRMAGITADRKIHIQ